MFSYSNFLRFFKVWNLIFFYIVKITFQIKLTFVNIPNKDVYVIKESNECLLFYLKSTFFVCRGHLLEMFFYKKILFLGRYVFSRKINLIPESVIASFWYVYFVPFLYCLPLCQKDISLPINKLNMWKFYIRIHMDIEGKMWFGV